MEWGGPGLAAARAQEVGQGCVLSMLASNAHFMYWRAPGRSLDKLTSLDEYVSRMKEGQKQIYYLAGKCLARSGRCQT